MTALSLQSSLKNIHASTLERGGYDEAGAGATIDTFTPPANNTGAMKYDDLIAE